MQPHDRLPYEPIVGRKPLRFPDGVRLVIWPVMSLEVWDISRPMARLAITPPQGQPLQPDHPNWSWHEYGMRVGFWRIKRMLEQLKMSLTATINARVCEMYPQVVRACLDNGWEVNAHSYEQIPMHKVADQRGAIFKTMDTIEKFIGQRPRGWFGPGLTQTFDTVDLLAEAGFEYIGDWVADDDPVTLKTKHKSIVALPYNFELHDIVVMSLQGHSADVFYQRTKDQFDCLYEEAKERAKIMAIAVHPYLSGVPHRIGHVRRTFEEILSKPGVVTWDGSKILDWYLAQRKTG
jgi:allantoinase